MILDYRWDPAMRLWVVIDTRNNQKISVHCTANDAVNMIICLEGGRDRVA